MSRGDKVMYSVVVGLLVILALLWLDIKVFKSWTWAQERNQTFIHAQQSERATVWAGQTHAKITFDNASFFISKSGEEVEQGVFAVAGKAKELHYRRYEVYTISVDGKTIARHRVLVEEK